MSWVSISVVNIPVHLSVSISIISRLNDKALACWTGGMHLTPALVSISLVYDCGSGPDQTHWAELGTDLPL